MAGDADLVLCMSIHPGYSGQEFMPDASTGSGGCARPAGASPVQVDGGIDDETIGLAHAAGATLLVAGSAIFGARTRPGSYRGLVQAVA